MAKSVEDRVYEFLRTRGAAGADAAEIAREFLQAKTGGKIAATIVQAMLGPDARFEKTAAGGWRLATAGPPPATAPAAAAAGSAAAAPPKLYTVVEFLLLPLPDGDVPIEAAALRVPPGPGRNEAQTLIQYARALPPATKLPEGFDRAALANALPLPKVLEGLAKFSRGTTVLCFEKTVFHARVCAGGPLDKELDHLALKTVARRLKLVPPDATLESTAQALGVLCPEWPRAAERARVCAELLAVLRERYAEQRAAARGEAAAPVERGPRPAAAEADLAEVQKPALQEVDFSRYAFDAGFLQTMSEAPGVYIMLDAAGNALYVGKARNLRERVWSYFRRRMQRDEKTERILESVYDIVVEPVGSELEALLAECRAIRELQPPINTQYDVHERHPSRERPGNVILILPSLAEGHAELFLVSRGEYLTQAQVPRDDPGFAEDIVKAAYFEKDAAAAPDESERRPDEIEILWSWLERNKDKVNRVDVDAVGDPAEVIRLLGAYLRENLHGERTYHR